MPEATTEEGKDPVLEGLETILAEFKSHKERVAARRREVNDLYAAGTLDEKALGKIVLELYSEIHDTALSFQEDVARIVYSAFAEAALEEDDDEEPLDDDDELDSVLLPGDAALLVSVLSDHDEILKNMLTNADQIGLPPEEKKRVAGMKKQAEEALALVEEITVLADADAAEGEDDEEGDDEAEEPAPAN